ncbi:MAG TPA: ABC transporter permease subunit [Verrucomicrobiae bacterium]|nr:ABC transporter permease subunit [Verrucomicrobiae bacterium]
MLGAGTWPVVHRELRAAARWPFGRWLRVGGALGGIGAFWFSSDVPFDELGPELFERIHSLLLWLICAIVPALAADSLARERREGTLGLLFMTPLTASGIVLGKTLAQVLRALTVWLAVMPVLTIPFLTGGVTWADVLSFLIIELCVGSLCLAAGILATSLTDNRAIAFILAFLLMGAFVAGSNHYADWWMQRHATTRTGWGARLAPGSAITSVTLPNGSVFYLTGAAVWGPPRVAAVTPGHPRVDILATDFVFAFLMLFAALRFAGWRVERSWQDKIPSVRQQNYVKRYCTPVFKRWFARGMRRTLEWNPIAWLQQYSWIMIPQSHFFYGGSLVMDENWFWTKDLEVLAIYLTLPVIATSCALRFKSLIVGSALTVAVVIGPAAVLFFHDYLNDALNTSAPPWLSIDISAFLEAVPLPPVPVCVMAAHGASTYFAFKFLRRTLARRNYSF